MTVLVVKCNRADDYNNYFIKRFQPVLQQNDRDALAYFRKMYGGAAQGRKDTFTTELVNVMSGIANTQGTEYCSRTGVVINEMLALKSMSDLAAYAAVKDIAPAGASMCPAASASRRRSPSGGRGLPEPVDRVRDLVRLIQVIEVAGVGDPLQPDPRKQRFHVVEQMHRLGRILIGLKL